MLVGGGRYAETHHIRPLGRNHKGIDKETNMIVLCPNHHAMMDFGAIAIHPDQLTIISPESSYPQHPDPLQLVQHPIGKEFLEYHMENIFNKM
jgi:predicted restriction endonuclease